MRKSIIGILTAVVLVGGILGAVVFRQGGGALTVTYPFDGTLFPRDIASPTIVWADSSDADIWRVEIAFADGGAPVTAETDSLLWTPPREVWEEIKERSLEKTARVTVSGFGSFLGIERRFSRKSFDITTSEDAVDAPIFYRSVTLPFEFAVNNVETIKWCLGDISSYDPPRVMLEDLPVCGNCHSFSNDGRFLGMDVDYANDKGSYIVADIQPHVPLTTDNIITWSDYRRSDGEPTFGLLSQVSPDGRYTVSTVKDRSVFVPVEDLYYSQLFFPLKGILIYYDRETGTFDALDGADDNEYVQSNPAWSPGGDEIMFARSKAGELQKVGNSVLLTREQCEKYLTGGEKFRFDLYRIPFDDGRGGEPEPVEGASNNGKSNYFAKYSPDGKWVVFCQSDSFMLLQPDSRLHIIPAGGGEAREMTCNTDEMNSWHSWSPNSRWIVFSSKVFSHETQLFLTHVDENGNDSPPVLLSRFVAPERAANIPEFVNVDFDDFLTLDEQFIDYYSYFHKSGQLFDQGRYAEAEKFLRKSVELNPDFAMGHKNLGLVMTKMNRLDEAEKEWRLALDLGDDDPMLSVNLASIHLGRNEVGRARELFADAIEKDPELPPAHIGYGVTWLIDGNLDRAQKSFEKAIELDPGFDDGYYRLGVVLAKKEQFQDAEKMYRKALDLNPRNANALLGLAQVLAQDERTVPDAINYYNKAMELASSNPHDHIRQGNMYLKQGDYQRAMAEFDKLLQINPESQSLRMYVNQLKNQRVSGR